jgi:hypothetical protein
VSRENGSEATVVFELPKAFAKYGYLHLRYPRYLRLISNPVFR